MRKQWKDETPTILAAVKTLITTAPNMEAETLSELIKGWAAENEVRLGMVMAPLRIALVGALRGPDVFAICSVLGKENCIKRLDAAIATV